MPVPGSDFAFSGPDPVAVKCVQIGLSLALVALVYGIARRTGDIRAARIAAWLTALDPTFAAYTHYLFSETLFLTLLTAALYTIARDPEGRSASNRIVTGLLFGLTALTRGVVLYFLPLWVVWEWIRGRRPPLGIRHLIHASRTMRSTWSHSVVSSTHPTLR